MVKDPYTLSSTIGALLADAPRRARLAQLATARLAELDLATAADRFVDLLSAVAPRAK
jgi:hypothetical protein